MSKSRVGFPAGARQRTESDSRRMFRIAALLLSLSLILFLFQLINSNLMNVQARGLESLPISIRAESEADYSGDPRPRHIPPIDEKILIEIITDMPATGSPQDRVGTLQAALLSPVPTMTPDYRYAKTTVPNLGVQVPTQPLTSATKVIPIAPTTTATRSASATPTARSSSSSGTTTKTPRPATRTPTPSRTATLTRTATATRTLTPTITATGTPTPTNTATFTSTSTHTLTPTQTDTPTLTTSTTDTSMPTETPTATLSETPSPTVTPTNSAAVTLTPTDTATVTPSPTNTFTLIQTPTDTHTPTTSATDTPTPTPTFTGTPTFTSSATNTATPFPSSTPTATFTETPTATATATLVPTATDTPTASRTATLTPALTPTVTATDMPTFTPTPTFTSTATSSSSPTSTPLPTFTFTPTLTFTPSASPAPGLPACYSGTPNGLLPSDDSYINASSPTSNYGSDNKLEVRPDNIADRRGLIKFDLSSIPANSTVTSATLYLYEQGNKTGQTTYIYRVTSDWSESTVTWNSWSTPGGNFDSRTAYFSFIPDQNNCMLTMDITSLVRAWVNGTFDNYGLMLYSTGPNHIISYASKEVGTAGRLPKLNIVYSVLTQTPTPVSTATPTFTYTPPPSATP